MLRKLSLLFLLVCAMLLANSASADYVWRGYGVDNNWLTADNWGTGASAPTVADGMVWTKTGLAPFEPLINTAVPDIDWMNLARDITSGTTSSLTIETGGSLNITGSSGLRLGAWGKATVGILYMNGGLLNAIKIEGGAPSSTGNIIMENGVINVSTLNVASYSNSSGHIQLNGGTINVGGSFMLGINEGTGQYGSMDIEEGIMIVNGDYQAGAQWRMDKGVLTGYGDVANVRYSYDSVSDTTTLWAVPEPATMVLLGLGCFVLRRKR